MEENRDNITLYNVVKNSEEQYSIWPANRPLPLGWTEVGKPASKPDCLSYIEKVWTDMRPRSLREQMNSQQSSSSSAQ